MMLMLTMTLLIIRMIIIMTMMKAEDEEVVSCYFRPCCFHSPDVIAMMGAINAPHNAGCKATKCRMYSRSCALEAEGRLIRTLQNQVDVDENTV